MPLPDTYFASKNYVLTALLQNDCTSNELGASGLEKQPLH